MDTIMRSVTNVVTTLFRKAFHYKIQEIYERNVEEDPHMLGCVPDCYVTQEMCESPVEKDT